MSTRVISFKEIIMEVNKETRKILKKRNVSFCLKSKASNDSYSFRIGNTEVKYFLKHNYMTGRFIQNRDFPAQDDNFQQVLEHILRLSSALNIQVLYLSKRQFTDSELQVATKEYGFSKEVPRGDFIPIYVGLQHSINSPNSPEIITLDRNHKVQKAIPIIKELEVFLKEVKQEYPTSIFDRTHVIAKQAIYGVSYHYRGNEGLLSIHSTKHGYALYSTSLGTLKDIKMTQTVTEIAKAFLEEAYEQNRLKNLIEPNRKHFDVKMKEKGIKIDESKKIFSVLLNYMDAEAIEEKIITSQSESLAEKGVVILYVLDFICVFSRFGKTKDLFHYRINDIESSLAKFDELVIERVKEEMTMKINRFQNNIMDISKFK